MSAEAAYSEKTTSVEERASPAKAARTESDDPYDRKLPTVGELRACIPAHCFEKHLGVSLAYLALDVAILVGLYKTQPFFEACGIAGLLFWYFVIGMMGFAIFVVGHDCGHGTFSNYFWINDIVGHLTHGAVFAPYWPWQKTHRLHHTFTGHLKKDHGHPWVTEDHYGGWGSFNKFYANNISTATVRWFFYTIAGITDGSHFWPGSRVFRTTTERVQCAVSATVCLVYASLAYYYFGTPYMFVKFYVLPVIAQGFWLTMVTYLQHQTDDIRVYEDGTWNYVKGQLQTIDRPYGFGIDQLMHHITDGHVAHHLFFTAIPHYHLMEATRAIEEKLRPYHVYRKQQSFDFLWQFASLNARLQYLVGEGTGLLRYARSKAE